MEGPNGLVVELAFPANGSGSITHNGAGVASVGSLEALSNASGSASFYDAVAKLLIVRLRGGAGEQNVQISASFANTLPARAATAASVQPGLRKTMLSGTWSSPFTDLSSNPVTAQSDVTGLDLSGLQPGGAMVLEGYVNIPETGVYSFATSANGNVNLEWTLGDERLLSGSNGFNLFGFDSPRLASMHLSRFTLVV